MSNKELNKETAKEIAGAECLRSPCVKAKD